MEEFTRDHEYMESLRASAARPLNSKGDHWSIVFDQDDLPDVVSGPTYELGDQSIVLTETGQLYSFSEDSQPELIDNNTAVTTYGEVILQNLEDSDITRTRDHLAKVLSATEPDLEIALKAHLSFTGGKVEPTEKEGITFYSVAEADGVTRYWGLKDGLRYVLRVLTSAEGCDCGECEIGAYEILDERMSPAQIAA